MILSLRLALIAGLAWALLLPGSTTAFGQGPKTGKAAAMKKAKKRDGHKGGKVSATPEALPPPRIVAEMLPPPRIAPELLPPPRIWLDNFAGKTVRDQATGYGIIKARSKNLPKVGELAPDFELRTADGKQTIRLSLLRGKRPIVLVFGSFT